MVAEQITEAELLIAGEILFPFEETPAALLQKGFMPGGRHMTGFRGPHFIQGVVEFGHDVEPVENVERL